MSILAIDPGASCGWASSTMAGVHRNSGVKKLTEKDDPFPKRFRNAREFFRNVIVREMPTQIVCERMGYFQSYNTTLSMYGMIAQLEEMAWTFELPIAFVSPNTVKKFATGSGKATKAEMRHAAERRWPAIEKIRNDQADALWIGECWRKTKNG